MPGASTLIAASFAVQGIAELSNSFSQSQAIRSQAKVQQAQFETNQRIAEFNANDAIRRGRKEAKRVRQRGKRLIGSQRATLAASGIEIGADTALQIQEQTAAAIEVDAITIKSNAYREAFGFRTQVIKESFQSQVAGISAGARASSTLATGGLSALAAFTRAGGAFPTTIANRPRAISPGPAVATGSSLSFGRINA